MYVALDALGADADVNRVGMKARGLGIGASLRLPVPPGFVVAADQPIDVAALRAAIANIEAATDARLGDRTRPLLLSVRASSPTTLPGQLDTALCVGATLAMEPALAGRLGSRAAALGAIHQCAHDAARIAGTAAAKRAPRGEAELATAIAELAAVDASVETIASIASGIRARSSAAGVEPIAIVVQAMTLGSAESAPGAPSGALVAHSRHPVTGEPGPRGEWVAGELGADLTGGRVSPAPLAASESPRSKERSLQIQAPTQFQEIGRIVRALERAFQQPVEVELAMERGAVHLLQVRPAALGPVALVAATVALVEQGDIDRREAFRRVDVSTLRRAGRTELPDAATLQAAGVVELGRGLVASPGVASGRLFIEPQDVLRETASGPVVLVRSDASPDDAPAVRAAVAVATASGGLTSHAAVMSRALGRPCAVSIDSLRIDERAGVVHAPTRTAKVGEWVTVDGTEGRLLLGRAEPRWSTRSPAALAILAWANEAAGLSETEPGPWYEALRR